MEKYTRRRRPHPGVQNTRLQYVSFSYLGKLIALSSVLAVATLSGPGGVTFRSYDLLTGDLLHESLLHNSVDGRSHDLQEVEIISALDSTPEGSTIFTLTNGNTVSRIDGQSGDVVWRWRPQDNKYIPIVCFMRGF